MCRWFGIISRGGIPYNWPHGDMLPLLSHSDKLSASRKKFSFFSLDISIENISCSLRATGLTGKPKQWGIVAHWSNGAAEDHLEEHASQLATLAALTTPHHPSHPPEDSFIAVRNQTGNYSTEVQHTEYSESKWHREAAACRQGFAFPSSAWAGPALALA